MNIFRGIGRWLLAVAIAAMIGVWITSAVLQATLLNRDTTKRWLAESGAYDKALRSLLPLEGQGGVATKEDMQKAFDATFPPGYVKQQTETVLDATYDWVDGKAQTVAFSIPVNEKRDEFLINLRKQIEPRIAALPPCTTRITPNINNPTCLPQGMTAADFTANTIRLADDDPFLNAPLTQESLGKAGLQPPDMSYVPTATQFIRQMAFILPVLIVLAAAAYVLLHDDKIRGLGVMGRRVFYQGLIITIGGVFMWVAGTNIDLATTTQDGDAQQTAIIANILNPFVQGVLPDVGKAVTLFSGIVTVAGAIAWVASHIIRRKYSKVTTFTPDIPNRQAPQPPQQATPTTLPAPQPAPARPPQPAQTRPKPPVPPRIIQ